MSFLYCCDCAVVRWCYCTHSFIILQVRVRVLQNHNIYFYAYIYYVSTIHYYNHLLLHSYRTRWCARRRSGRFTISPGTTRPTKHASAPAGALNWSSTHYVACSTSPTSCIILVYALPGWLIATTTTVYCWTNVRWGMWLWRCWISTWSSQKWWRRRVTQCMRWRCSTTA